MFYKKIPLILGICAMITLSACNNHFRNAQIEPPASEIAAMQKLEPAAGHLMMDYMPKPIPVASVMLPDSIESPIWQQNRAIGYEVISDKPKIVVVIDDLGLNRKRSDAVADLPGPLTLAYLPYGKRLKEQTKRAQQNGHELMVHMPMQPLGEADPGPNALLAGLSEKDILKRIRKNLSAFDGYVGINNHMGSAFTQDVAGLNVLMAELQKRDILYLDSRTSALSKAESIARKFNVATTVRDVFIDHEMSPVFVENALKKVERTARRHGSAIAIGHPHDVTTAALAEWLPTLEAKGFQLVPITSVMFERDPRINEYAMSREN
jgi:hypothetical protein